jgi:hypothetical protein
LESSCFSSSLSLSRTRVPPPPRGLAAIQNADYAPSVMFDVGKIVFIGGGSTTNLVEVIDLNLSKPAWAVVAPMKFRRRQHNATLLPHGTVLVTGEVRVLALMILVTTLSGARCLRRGRAPVATEQSHRAGRRY